MLDALQQRRAGRAFRKGVRIENRMGATSIGVALTIQLKQRSARAETLGVTPKRRQTRKTSPLTRLISHQTTMINNVSDSRSYLGSTGSAILRQPIRSSPFPDKVTSVSHSVINLHPKGIDNGVKKYQAFSKEITLKQVSTIGWRGIKREWVINTAQSMGYISDFNNTGQEALLIHGTKGGNVSLLSHSVRNRKEFTVKEFIGHIQTTHSLDLTKKKETPLHILSCFGTSNGVYQAFSNELNREVKGYGDGGVIVSSSELKDYFDESTTSVISVIGDIERDKPEHLSYVRASVNSYFPKRSGSNVTAQQSSRWESGSWLRVVSSMAYSVHQEQG